MYFGATHLLFLRSWTRYFLLVLGSTNPDPSIDGKARNIAGDSPGETANLLATIAAGLAIMRFAIRELAAPCVDGRLRRRILRPQEHRAPDDH